MNLSSATQRLNLQNGLAETGIASFGALCGSSVLLGEHPCNPLSLTGNPETGRADPRALIPAGPKCLRDGHGWPPGFVYRRQTRRPQGTRGGA